MSCTVTIESRDPDTGEVMRDVFELTPAPAQGEERRVLVELVTGIHPAAVEISFAAGVAVLDDAGREIIASFGPSGPAPFDDPNQQQTLFGP